MSDSPRAELGVFNITDYSAGKIAAKSEGYTTYFLASLGLPGIVEDGPLDLIKVGETETNGSRQAGLISRSSIPLRETIRITPMRDVFIHSWLFANAERKKFSEEEARRLGLEAPTEWWWGGADMWVAPFLLLLADRYPDFNYEVRCRDGCEDWLDGTDSDGLEVHGRDVHGVPSFRDTLDALRASTPAIV